ncbi:MAG: DNA-binding response regulator [Methylobacter sp.]|nr:MAG: DNA-binding response regulator [Methylobacter sp.]
MVTRILLIDDDVELAGMLAEYLTLEGFDMVAVHEGEAGRQEAVSGNYDLVVLDVMLPGMKGIEVLNRIRLDSQIPVLMLTAKGDDVDRIVGLESGADDYVPKPCTPRELVARIRAILRRLDSSQHPDDKLVEGPLTLWPKQRKAQWQGRLLDLTSSEFSLLEVLAVNAGAIVGKKELSEKGLGRPLARFDRSIDVHVSSIRQKLGNLPDGRSCILTVRGKGYLFVKV